MGHVWYGNGQWVLGLVAGEGERAEQLGAVAERAGDDLDVLGGGRNGEAPTASRIGSSSRSPAALRSPPTTTRSGLR